MKTSMSLDSGWEFIKSKEPFNVRPSSSGEAWQAVSVPHCWDVEGNQNGGRPYVHPGPVWYRCQFQVPVDISHERVFLRFEGVATVASVFVNGHHVGKHEGAFSAFCFDVTPYLVKDPTNLLEVCVDNTLNVHIPPIAGDYTIFGGIYREVKLLFREKISLDQLDDASGGVFFHQTQVSAESARLKLVTRLRNEHDQSKNVRIRCILRNHEDKEVCRVEKEFSLSAHDVRDLTQEVYLVQPRLWKGIDDPYRYRAVVEILEGDRVVDEVTLLLGICSWKVDLELGVLLNGRPYKIRGAGRHQDFMHCGWVIGRSHMQQDLDLMTEMGWCIL